MSDIEDETSNQRRLRKVPGPIWILVSGQVLVGAFVVFISISLTNSISDIRSVNEKMNKFQDLIARSDESIGLNSPESKDLVVEMLEINERNFRKMRGIMYGYSTLFEKYSKLLAFAGILLIGISIVQFAWLLGSPKQGSQCT